MAIYFPPSLREFEPRWMVFSTWTEHMPFAYDLISAQRPKKLVELGVYRGLSYFTFCQSVQAHKLKTRCFAVDTWEGDKHTDAYEEEVWEQVASHNREHYSGFSTLMRMTFDQALPQFEDRSLDLIHLDGLHTYEAVKADFDNWYPKLRPGGIFLFHDIRARLQDFGVWRFWDELEQAHETFAFDQGYGLGVLRKPGGRRKHDAPLLKLLFHEDSRQRKALLDFYTHLARFAELKRKLRRQEKLRQIQEKRHAVDSDNVDDRDDLKAVSGNP